MIGFVVRMWSIYQVTKESLILMSTISRIFDLVFTIQIDGSILHKVSGRILAKKEGEIYAHKYKHIRERE